MRRDGATDPEGGRADQRPARRRRHRRERTADLTDTMMVASLDPVGQTVSMVSLPRDLIGVPLGDGSDVFGPKLNSLMSYADRHPEGVPAGRDARRSRTRSARCSGSRSTTTRGSTSPASSTWSMRSAASTSTWQEGDRRPDTTTATGSTGRGFHDHGRAAPPDRGGGARLRPVAQGRSARATSPAPARQQRDPRRPARTRLTARRQPALAAPATCSMRSAKTIQTDVPAERLPELAAIVDEVGARRRRPASSSATRWSTSARTPGTARRRCPNLPAIRAMAAALFSAPGTPPVPWPTPKPTRRPTQGARPLPKATPAS